MFLLLNLEIILGGIIIQKMIGMTIKEILIYTIIHFQNGVQSKIGKTTIFINVWS